MSTMLRFGSVGAILLGAGASEWFQMPNGRYYHSSCIHQFDDGFHVRHSDDGSSTVSFADGRNEIELPPCPYAPRTSVSSPLAAEAREASNTSVGYYSDWVVYAQTVHSHGFGYMSSTWKVPAKPASQGPFPPLVESSVYIFNGLENGGGVKDASDMILQPVLQYGKSGCLIDPFKFSDWYFTSYEVVGGRAYCGSNVGPLSQGEELVGIMTLTDASTNTWKVDSVRSQTSETSTYSTGLGNRTLDAAYATLEAMILYNCDAFPSSGSVTFTDNALLDVDGVSSVGAQWVSEFRHTECSQTVSLPSAVGDPVTLSWDPSPVSLFV